MCWCILLDAGFVGGCTRCEDHVGEVLRRHLPEPRVGEHKRPLSLARGLTPLHLVTVSGLDHPSREWRLEFLGGCAFPLRVGGGGA